ncbi:hypothetical protein [Kutzneria sp. CA-103260]|uniref:hypothetical protein n=1 Tax=Kutzneria sp. CA-103260 TaxID=2802641 RepID=UPI001BA57B01|nr:hypothetical protein [Kutzneria sp. CA-103260]QUQ71954.1 hypothetical protein JJ691_97410 [Kutzneria sp. CA-103260]
MARLLGCLLLCGMAVVAVLRPVSSAAEAVVLGALIACHLAAFLFGKPHISALAMGFAASLLWLDLVVVLPPVPSSIGLAVVFAAAGALGTLWITRRPLLSLHTAATAALCISAFAWLLLTHGPARFVPAIAGPNPLAQSRIETPDGYYWLLLIGAVLSLAQCGIQLVEQRRRQRGAVSVGENRPVAPAQF